jgi:ubiquinone/menaquinone biosynthesis C-methylase UbiE
MIRGSMNNLEIDFGKSAQDYVTYRQGFPEEFFKRLFDRGIIDDKKIILDIGTGTGSIARGVAEYGSTVYAIDISENMLNAAKSVSQNYSNIHYQLGSAENTGMNDQQVDVVMVGQAWHWFNHDLAVKEIKRIIKPGGS